MSWALAVALPAGPRGEEAMLVLGALGALSLLFLALAALLASAARRAPRRKPARRSFEHGRRAARSLGPMTVEAALAALRECPVGRVGAVRADERHADVTVERKRSQPCAQVAGFLAGVFESAWAHEVVVSHPGCAGEAGACRYEIRWAPSASGAPAAAASTRGSGGARRRWPPARPGGG